MGVEFFLYITGSQARIISHPRQHLAMLEVSLVVTTEEGACYWHLVHRMLLNSLQHTEWLLPPSQRIIWPHMSVVLRLRKTCLDGCNSHSGQSLILRHCASARVLKCHSSTESCHPHSPPNTP